MLIRFVGWDAQWFFALKHMILFAFTEATTFKM